MLSLKQKLHVVFHFVSIRLCMFYLLRQCTVFSLMKYIFEDTDQRGILPYQIRQLP